MHFEVKAVRAGNDVIAMSFDAADMNDAAGQARAEGYEVLSVKARRDWLRWLHAGGAKFSLMLFSQELRALLDAGLTQVEALETMVEKERHPHNRNILQRIIESLYEGHPLSHALQQFPEIFPPLYIATIHASEKTGDLDESLARYIDYQSRMDVVRKKIVSASIYPMLLLGAGGLVTLFLMLYVVPRFSRVYEDIGSELPFFSRMLMQWGQMLETHRTLALAVIAGCVAGTAYMVTRPGFRQWVMRALWRIPAVGERIRVYQLARFYRTLGMLLRGGIPIVSALEMVSGLLEHALREQLALASDCIREGQPISYAMETYGLTTPVALRLLRVGEHTGGMGEMTERIANFYDEEMARWVDWFTRLFEPLLMAVIGLVIGVIVILMYFPIFELAGSIQ
jgi:general secretion pathway protein F